MERLQGKTGWYLLHSKAVSAGRIEGAFDGHFVGMRNSRIVHQSGDESLLNLAVMRKLRGASWITKRDPAFEDKHGAPDLPKQRYLDNRQC